MKRLGKFSYKTIPFYILYLKCVFGVFMNKEESKRVQVSFSEKQWKLIEKLKGEMGVSDAEVVRNVVISWLSEKSFISTSIKKEKM